MILYNIGLFALWLILVGDLTIRNLALGAVLVVATRISINYMNINISSRFNYKIFLYIPWLLKEILFSAIAVIKIIWNPKMPINPAFEHITTIQQADIGRVLYANSITLTPGTYTVDMGLGELFVHSLVKQDLWSSEMDSKIMEAIKC